MELKNWRSLPFRTGKTCRDEFNSLEELKDYLISLPENKKLDLLYILYKDNKMNFTEETTVLFRSEGKIIGKGTFVGNCTLENLNELGLKIQRGYKGAYIFKKDIKILNDFIAIEELRKFNLWPNAAFKQAADKLPVDNNTEKTFINLFSTKKHIEIF